MPLDLILSYCWDAARFALPFGVLFFLGKSLKQGSDRKRVFWEALFVSYLCALLKITAIRQASFFDLSFFSGTESLLLVPLQTTLKEWTEGLWPFLYHTLGNIVWFMPLGMFLRGLWKKHAKQCLGIGFALSLLIEVLQYLLQSGISDVDDLLLNSLGTVLGFVLWGFTLALWEKLCYSKRKCGEE